MDSTTFEENLGRRDKYCDIFLPKRTDGQICYNVLGKLIAAKLFEEVLCASYVDPKYGKRLTVPGVPDTEWEYWGEEDGVLLFRKYNHKTRITCFMGRSVLDVPMSEVQGFLSDFTSKYQYDNMCQEIKIIKTISESDHIVYMRHQVSRFFGLIRRNRDFCFYCHRGIIDGCYFHSVISVEDPTCPERRDYVRSELLPGCGWLLKPYEKDPSKTLVSYVAHLNIRGVGPRFLVEKILRTQPVVIARIGKILKRNQQQQVKLRGKVAQPEADDYRDDIAITSSVNVEKSEPKLVSGEGFEKKERSTN